MDAHAFPLAGLCLIIAIAMLVRRYARESVSHASASANELSLRKVREMRKQRFAAPNRDSARIRRRAGSTAPSTVSAASLAASSAATVAVSAAAAAARAWRRARASASCAIAAQAPSQRATSEISRLSDAARLERALGAVDRLSVGGLQKESRLHRLAIGYLEGALTQPERTISAQNSKWAAVWADPDARELLSVAGFAFHATSNTVQLQPLTEQRKKLVRAALGRLKSIKGQDFWFD